MKNEINEKRIKMELLIEIGVEELPAIPFLKERANIAPKWRAVAKMARGT